MHSFFLWLVSIFVLNFRIALTPQLTSGGNWNLDTFEMQIFWRSDFKWSGFSYGFSHSLNHSKNRPFKIWTFLSQIQMCFFKVDNLLFLWPTKICLFRIWNDINITTILLEAPLEVDYSNSFFLLAINRSLRRFSSCPKE